jgi:hypothetical protein
LESALVGLLTSHRMARILLDLLEHACLRLVRRGVQRLDHSFAQECPCTDSSLSCNLAAALFDERRGRPLTLRTALTVDFPQEAAEARLHWSIVDNTQTEAAQFAQYREGTELATCWWHACRWQGSWRASTPRCWPAPARKVPARLWRSGWASSSRSRRCGRNG